MRRLLLAALLLTPPVAMAQRTPLALGTPYIQGNMLMQPMDDGSTSSIPLNTLAQFNVLLAGTVAYQSVTPTLNATIQMAAGKNLLFLTGAATLTAVTVQLPANPADGQIARIASQSAITSLKVADANGVTVATLALGALSAAGGTGVLFQFEALQWVRVG